MKDDTTLKVSIITVTLNQRELLPSCLRSVADQTYPNIEHIVVDGGSQDGTLDVIRGNGTRIARWISEKDNGQYDAMNKGLGLATGEVIGFLHADDLLADSRTVARIAAVFTDPAIDGCYGDLVYLQPDLSRVVRRWRADFYDESKIRRGWMIPHPTLYLRRGIYERLGGYRTEYRISADYEFILRLLTTDTLNLRYLPYNLVMMRRGGRSNSGLANLLRKSREDQQIWSRSGLPANPLLFIKKPFFKIRQIIHGV